MLEWTDQDWVVFKRFRVIELCVVCEHFVTNRVLLNEACKWSCIQNEKYRAQHRASRNTKIQGRFCWFVVVYEDILFPVRKVGSKPVQGCTTNAKVVFEAREKNLMVYCVKLQKDPRARESKFCYHRGNWEDRWVYGEEQSLCCAHTGKQTDGFWPDCVLTDARRVVKEQVFPEVLTERVDYKWVCSF